MVRGVISELNASSCDIVNDASSFATSALENPDAVSVFSLDSTLIAIIGGVAFGMIMVAALFLYLIRNRRHTKKGKEKGSVSKPPKEIYMIETSQNQPDLHQTTHTTVGRTAIAVPVYLEFEFSKTLSKIKKIGTGGFAEVWRCDVHDNQLFNDLKGGRVAAKIFQGLLFMYHCRY